MRPSPKIRWDCWYNKSPSLPEYPPSTAGILPEITNIPQVQSAQCLPELQRVYQTD